MSAAPGERLRPCRHRAGGELGARDAEISFAGPPSFSSRRCLPGKRPTWKDVTVTSLLLDRARTGDEQAFAELLPGLKKALADDTVSVIACPVDYSANAELIRSLGDLDESLS